MGSWEIIEGPFRTFAFRDFESAMDKNKKIVISIVEQKAFIFKQKNSGDFYSFEELKMAERDDFVEVMISHLKENKTNFYEEIAYNLLTSEAFVEINKNIK